MTPDQDAAFRVETGGYVTLPGPKLDLIEWSDLDPFTQAYGLAMARELYERLIAAGMMHEAALQAVAFRNWAPETLAVILRDCGKFQAEIRPGSTVLTANDGRRVWQLRQNASGDFDDRLRMPPLPLTVFLDNDGKVRVS